MSIGRPSAYTDELAAAICARLANAESLLSILKDEGMPSYTTVMRWQRDREGFRQNLARAREDMADHLSHQIIAIADEQSDDWTDTRFGPVFNKEAAARSRLRIDARLKLMQLLKPKSYGEKLALEHSVDEGLAARLERATQRANSSQ